MNHRRLIAVLLALMFVMANAWSDDSPALDELGWMAGAWSSEKDGMSMEEWWTEPRGGVMLGLHRDVRKGRPAFFEYLRIEETADGPVYMASPKGRTPTPFPLIELGDKRATFANPDHDFPQRIIYWKSDDNTLCARAEGEREGETIRSQWCWSR